MILFNPPAAWGTMYAVVSISWVAKRVRGDVTGQLAQGHSATGGVSEDLNFAKEEEVVTYGEGVVMARGRLQRLVKLKGKETNLLPSLPCPSPLIRSLQ